MNIAERRWWQGGLAPETRRTTLQKPGKETDGEQGKRTAKYQRQDSKKHRLSIAELNKQEVGGFEVSFDLAQKFGGLKLGGDPGVVNKG